MITKLNYLIHTYAINEYLMPIELTTEQKNYVYASEADILNVALFGNEQKNGEMLIRIKKETLEIMPQH